MALLLLPVTIRATEPASLAPVMPKLQAAGTLRFDHPVWSPDNHHLALSDERGNGVFLYDTDTDSCLQITDAPSSGYACHFSHDGRRLGFKLLVPVPNSVLPLQIPVVYDLDLAQLFPLHTIVERAGVPSFADNGHIAFTVDQDLHVVDAAEQCLGVYPLGHYANLARISPDGTKVAYNTSDDHIWTIDLATGTQTDLTPGTGAFFNPLWSADSTRLMVSTVTGQLKTIEISSGTIHDLDAGSSPSWTPDSQTVFYCRTDRLDGAEVLESDIYSIQHDGTGQALLVGEPGMREMSAQASPDGQQIAFISMQDGQLYRAQLNPGSPPGGPPFTMGPKVGLGGNTMTLTTLDESAIRADLLADLTNPLGINLEETVMLTRDMPYTNQVYDTTDAFNGYWACGASSAIMGIAYYNVLPAWDITCSTPYTHISHYGAYVSEIYSFNGTTYDIRSKDAGGQWAYGGYGYIVRDNWIDTKGYMRDYFINHGLGSSVDWAPTWAILQAEVNADHPCVVLNSLTTAGHYITTTGYVGDSRTAVFNDPYGNKNTPGYPSYDGVGAMYDWPGYNNGYANLNTVHCFIYCRADLPPAFLAQPTSQSVLWGKDATFTVEAFGTGALSYQWQLGTTDLTTGGPYTGVNTATLTILNVTDQEQGDYRCVVTNTFGTTASDAATLTVIGPAIAPGDMDRDGDVDLDDFGPFQACLTGFLVPQEDPDCEEARLDYDSDVDSDDLDIFLDCISGPGIPADPHCAG